MARKYATPGSREFAWWYAQKRRRDRKTEEPGPTPGPTGILLVDYPGAAAAYSLRDLTGEEPTVVRVRRSGNNAEQDFTAAQITDGTLVAFVGAGNNGLVTTWYDQSGNDNHATQATAGAQPKIVDNGALVTENGKAALDFDGVDDFLTGNSIISGETNRSIFIAYKSPQVSNLAPIFELASGSLAGEAYILTSEIALRCFSVTYVTTVGTANQSLLSLHQSGTTIQSDVDLYYNGFFSARESGSDGSINTSTGGFRIGSQQSGIVIYTDALVQELIVYPSDQSANRVGIETNINDHYEIFP